LVKGLMVQLSLPRPPLYARKMVATPAAFPDPGGRG